MTRHTLALALACGAHTACTRGTQAAVRLGTTTTIEQSGALAPLDAARRPRAISTW